MSWTELLLDHLLTTAMIFVAVWIATRFVKRPLIRHLLWGAVLIKFLLPPLVTFSVSWPGSTQPEAVRSVPAGNIADMDRVDPPITVPLSGNEVPESAGGDVEMTQPAPQVDFASSAQPSAEVWWPSRRQIVSAALVVWAVGTFAAFCMAVRRGWRFRRLLRQAAVYDVSLQTEVDELSRSIGMNRPPRAVLAGASVSPMVWAVFRPTLVFPSELWKTLPAAERRTLLLHELAHLARRDHWARRLELVVTLLWWWHPGVWLARRELHVAEEECCDVWVVARNDGGRRPYADALLATLDFLADPHPTLPPAACGIGQITQLERRMTMILHRPASRLGMGARLILGVAVLGLLGSSLSFAQNEDGDGPTKLDGKGRVTIENPKGISIESADEITIESVEAKKSNEPGAAENVPVQIKSGEVERKETPVEPIANVAGPSGHNTFLGQVTPDGKAFVAVGSDGAIRKFSREGGTLWVCEPSGVQRDLTQVAISSDGKRLAAGGFDGVVILVSLENGEELASARQPGGVRSLSFSDDGEWLVSGSWDCVARVWNAKTLEKVGETPVQALPVIADISPDGSLIVTATGEWKRWREPGELKLWDRETLDEVATLEGHQSELKGVSFSDDGQYLLSFGSDATARVWHVASRRGLVTYQHPNAVTTATFIPETKLIATGDVAGVVRFWDFKSTVVGPKPAELSKPAKAFRAHDKLVYRIDPTPDGSVILTNSKDRRLKVWSTNSAKHNPAWAIEKLKSEVGGYLLDVF